MWNLRLQWEEDLGKKKQTSFLEINWLEMVEMTEAYFKKL